MNFYNLTKKEVLENLAASEKGLSDSQIEKQLERYGPNCLSTKKGDSPLKILCSQFKDLMVVILIIAGFLSFGLGLYHDYELKHSEDPIIQKILSLNGHSANEITQILEKEGFDQNLILEKLEHTKSGEKIDGLVILIIVILNAVIGFIQEFKAEKSLEALKNMIHPRAKVIRNGKEIEIATSNLVPGDILILAEGDKIQADCRILEAIDLKINESALTGESLPKKKTDQPIKGIKAGIGDQDNIAFMGTIITHGRAKAVVIKTGMNTEFGSIANLTLTLKDEQSPLQKELANVGKFIFKVTLIITILFFLVRIMQNGDMIGAFIFAVAIAVAAVPEGLPATVTIALALGIQRMTKKKAIIRKLSSVETLGSTTVICSDKTGTLTENQMTVKEIYVNNKTVDVSGAGYNPEGSFHFEGKPIGPKGEEELHDLLIAATLCNDATMTVPQKVGEEWGIIGDPTEGALVVAAEKAKIDQEILKRRFPRIHEIPFDSTKKRMTTVHKTPKGKNIVYVKGAPDIIIELCTKIAICKKVSTLTKSQKIALHNQNQEMAKKALRVLAIARKETKKIDNKLEQELTFMGLIGMIDPPRPEVHDAVKRCKEAGIKVVVITGDYGLTATAIAEELGIIGRDSIVIEGNKLDSMNEKMLQDILTKEVLFARVSPEHKMRVVSSLKKAGHIVAVTGDGVNDAPALKDADIGVAMGRSGTDVSKEASDMILMDDSFATIVSAIEEGRTIYNDIKKFMRYIFSSNLGELFTVIFGMVMRVPLPILATQILWIDLGTDVLPALALGVDPSDKDIMKQKPRNPKERMITLHSFIRWMSVGLIIGIGAILTFVLKLGNQGWAYGIPLDIQNPIYIKALTMSFTVLVLYQMINVFNCRSSHKSLFSAGFFSNKFLIGTVSFSIILQILVVHVPLLQSWFHTTALTLYEWLIVIGVALTVFVYDEMYKLILRKRSAIE